MSDEKVFLVKPPLDKKDWDLGDILAIARSEGKRLLGTNESVRVLDLIRKPYGYARARETCYSCPKNRLRKK